MARARPKGGEGKGTAVNGPLAEVLTLAEAAAYLRVSEAEVLRWVEEQGLPARQAGKEWRFSRPAILEWLGPPARPRDKEGIWAAAGSWKDDPYLDGLLEEAYRKRGRPMVEER